MLELPVRFFCQEKDEKLVFKIIDTDAAV